MGMILGIDVGGSTTKIVAFSLHGHLIGTLQVKATDQITSVYGAIGHFVQQYQISLKEIVKIILTGVGASFFTEDIYEIPTIKINEFQAIGYGGLYLADMEEAFVASMGTGTAFVRATQKEIVHIGGSGVGGGTLIGLSSIMLNTSDIEAIRSFAEHGQIENIDLSVRDIMNQEVPSLPANLTASNFGKVKSTAVEADFAVGMINMIFQTIGMLAAFAVRNDTIKDVILTGNLTTFPQVQEIFSAIADIHAIHFIIPNNAVYATAIGAAVPYLERT
ncbi:MAG: Pantothenate kinase [Oscillospiraceae bacterium]|nr:Pantothenate kinase [Oscillospiraceae bacterium]